MPQYELGTASRRRLPRWRRATYVLMAVFALAATLVVPAIDPPAAHAQTDTSCDFANSGTGTYADTLCWFDLSDVDWQDAQNGQDFEVSIPGGYTLAFTLTADGGEATSSAFPTYSDAYLGNNGFYTGVSGEPAFYQQDNATDTDLELSDIELTSSSGEVVDGYALVGADAESTDADESITWNSSDPITSLTATRTGTGLGNACGGGFTGIGTKEVTCTGQGTSTKTGTAIVSSTNPSTFSQHMQGGGLQAVSFGVLISAVTLNKAVDGRFSGDSADISIQDSSGATIGSDSTGPTGDSASVDVPVVVDAEGSTFTLGETTNANLDNYVTDWSCTRNGEVDTSLPTGRIGTSADVDVGVGDDIECTITNSARPVSIAIDKQAGDPVDVNGNGITDAGDQISYDFTVTNTGDLPLDTVEVTDDTVGSVTCEATELAAGASTNCTADQAYTITDADESNGSVDNTATASGHVETTNDTVTSDPDSTSTPVEGPNPELTLTKSGSPSNPDDFEAGQQITYVFFVRNTGNVTVSDVDVSEVSFSGSGEMSDITCPAGILAPGGQMPCTATYTLTQEDVDAGEIDNTAVADGTDPDGGPVESNEDDFAIPADPAPGIDLEKSVDPETVSGPGEEVTYSFVVTNTGNVTLSDPELTETAFSGTGPPPQVDCPTVNFLPGQAVTCTATYTATAADANAGEVDNTATATATPANGEPPVSDPASAEFTIPAHPELSLTKTVDPTVVDEAGDNVTYSFEVENTGNVTVTDVSVDDVYFGGSDPLGDITCPTDPLPAGETMTCTADYSVTQDDVDSPAILNVARASGQPPTGDRVRSNTDRALIRTDRDPQIAMEKAASPATYDAPGDTITYTFEVTNTGNVSLSDPTIDESQFTGSGEDPFVVCPTPVILAPGQSTECTATYETTQADVDRGSIENTATATADPPFRMDPPVSDPDNAVVTADQSPELALNKTVRPTTVEQSGDQVRYAFIVENTGNVTVNGIEIAETAFTGSGQLSGVQCPAGFLEPGDVMPCTATYDVTQADVDQGSVDNTAVAQGTADGGPVESNEDDATVTIAADPALTLVKSADNTDELTAGETIDYSFVVTNTGNVTMADVGVDEVAFDGSGELSDIECPPGAASVAPGDQVTCTATYEVTQADVDRGELENTAIANGTPPTGDPVDSNEDSATIPADHEPGLTLDKSADNTDELTAGETIDYSFVVTNTGNVTENEVEVEELSFDGSGELSELDCVPPSGATLVPGESMECTATYEVTQADVDRGALDNTAIAHGTTPSDEPVDSNEDSVQIPSDREPSLELEKTADKDEITEVGQPVTYTFAVTNTGNVTLSDVGVDEVEFDGSGEMSDIVCAPGTESLAPGASATCTATYEVTQADVDRGRLDNTAVAHGTPPSDDPVDSNEDSVTIPSNQQPGLKLEKSSDTDLASKPGQLVTYTFAITNTGNVTLSDTAVNEGSFNGHGEMSTATCPPAAQELAPGDTVECTATYQVVGDDLTGEPLRNTATATGGDPSGDPVDSNPDNESIPTKKAHGPQPGIDIVKTSDTDKVTEAGQVVTYSFKITNTGDVPLQRPTVNEESFNGHGAMSPVTCPPGSRVLSPGETVVCTATYAVVEDDLTGEPLTNSATVTATDPDDDPIISGIDDETVATVDDDDDDLPDTGAMIGWGAIALAIACLVAGGVLIAAGRSRRKD
ncbi:DUF7507 domain-containing protein [Solicola gregarius]|uniref:DUF11 domain-containing protein n=1 Tax=Solicola gregarius TaxID=2908642 RepID=A0AA46TFM4_9ACTN|nr:hypothetical protein [Solicola gregarius]UYM03932.1 hypothetical protein L0C25_15435 [Solicola gregarius]